MAKQISKNVVGPLTATPDAVPAVSFVGPDGAVLGTLSVLALGLSDKQVKGLPPIVARLLVHAISQKVGDSYAGAADAENPLQYATDAIKETIEQLVKGEWRVTVAGGVRASLLARALARVTGRTVEEAMSVLENLEEAEGDSPEIKEKKKATLKQIRAQEAIKAATAAIKLEDAEKQKAKLEEQAKKGGDAGSLAGLFETGGVPA